MRSLLQLSLATGLLFASTASSLAQSKSELITTNEYYPLAVGSTWTYSTSEGTVTTKVVKHEEIGGFRCARLEATMSDNKKTSEYIRVTNDGVYRHQASEQAITKPLRFIKLPAKSGDAWDVDSTVLGKKLKGTYKLTIGSVKLKGDTIKDVLIVKSEDFTIDGQKLPHTYYFAKGKGLIKQEVEFAGEKVVMELESFTAGKQ